VAKKTQPVKSCCNLYTSINVLLSVLRYFFGLKNTDTSRHNYRSGIHLYSRFWEGFKVTREKAVEIFTKMQLNRLHHEWHFPRE